MKRIFLVCGLVMSMTVSVPASENRAVDYLLTISPEARAAMLGKIAGSGCRGTTAFNMGTGTKGSVKNIGSWSVKCTNGKSYNIGINPDGSSKVLNCSVLKTIAHIDCFKKLY